MQADKKRHSFLFYFLFDLHQTLSATVAVAAVLAVNKICHEIELIVFARFVWLILLCTAAA